MQYGRNEGIQLQQTALLYYICNYAKTGEALSNRVDKYAIARLLNIKQDESRQVLFLFLHYFFQGMGMALFFTVANTLYLAHFPVEDIPVVFMLSALLQITLGRLYAYIEHRLPFKVLLYITLGFLSVSPLLFRLGLSYYAVAWLPLALMVWYKGIFLLGDLEFWGLSSTLFDVRQAKRLFGLISAGDVPAKLLGYASVAILTPAIGLSNLLVVASVAFMASMAFLSRILKDVHEHSGHHQGHAEHYTTKKPGILVRIFKSEFILLLAFLNVVIAITMSVIDFSFLTEVEEKFHTEEELAAFFSWFYAVANGLIILSKLFLSSRVIDKIGVKGSLMILPLFLLGISIAVFATGIASHSHMPLMIYFAVMVLLGEVFKTVLQEPIFLAMFQPLQRHLRLHAHNVTKGLMEPIGLGMVGLAFYVGIALYHHVNLFNVNYALLSLCAGWLVLVLFTYRKYLEVLGKAIHKRFVEGSGLAVGDKNTMKVIIKKLESPHPEEVIYSIELLEKMDYDSFSQYAIKLLSHSSDNVKLHAIQKLAKLKLYAAKDALMAIIQREESAEVKEAAIKAFCAVAEDELDFVLGLLENEDRTIRNGAILGLLTGGDIEGTVLAGQQLLELTHSQIPNDKMLAATLIGELKMRNFYKPVEKFMDDENERVRESAIRAGGMIKNPRLLPRLSSYLADRKLYTAATDALKSYGEEALQFLLGELQKGNIHDNESILRIIHLCGRSGGSIANKILLECYGNNTDIQIKDTALYTLRLLHYQAANVDEAAMFDSDILRQFSLAHSSYRVVAYMQDHGADPLLQRAVEYEGSLAAKRVFALLAFLYNPTLIRRAKDAHLSGSKEHKANALEILDNILPKKYKEPLFMLLEDIPTISKNEKLIKNAIETNYNPASNLEIIERLLGAGSSLLSTWTIAAALYALRNNSIEEKELVKPYLDSKIKILKETAALIYSGNTLTQQITQNMGNHNNHGHNEETSGLLEIEKVLVLKSTRLFSETPENILVDIASIVQEERVSKDSAIFKKGELGNCMYIIYDGEVRIHDGDTTFITLKNRDFFGELALLDPEPRSATATALSDTLLLKLEQDEFYEMMSDRPEVGRGIMKILCQRLRNQNVLISELRAKTQLTAS